MDFNVIGEFLRTPAEILTIFVSIAGIIICLHHGSFFKSTDHTLAVRLRKVFVTDAAVYLVTLLMGIGLFFDWKWLVQIDVIIRPLVLFLNVYASVRLYRHYKKVK